MHEARTQQGGLPAPRGSDEREEPPLGEMTDGLGDHPLPTEEELRVHRLEPCKPLVRTHIGRTYGLGSHRLAAIEPSVVGEDRRLESLKLGTRLDPQFADQHLPGSREGVESLRLTPGSVQRDHQLAPTPLPEWLFSNHGLELRDELAWILAGEPRVDEILGRGASEFVEPLAIGRAEARVPVALVGGASPQTERLLEHRIGICRTAGIEESVALAGELLEPDRVNQVPVGLEHVPVSAEEDQLGVRVGPPAGPEGATEPRDVRDQRLLRVPRGTVTPKLLDEIVDGHDPTCACDEAGEDRSLLRSGDRQRFPARLRDLERAEDEETHTLLLCQAAAAVKRSAGQLIDVIVLNTTLVM